MIYSVFLMKQKNYFYIYELAEIHNSFILVLFTIKYNTTKLPLKIVLINYQIIINKY